MAFISFVLRSGANGSKLRESAALDSALRGDGYIPPAVALSGSTESTFSANIIDVQRVTTIRDGREYYSYRSRFDLEWELSQELNAPATPGSFPALATPVEFVIVASQYGEPITVLDGTTVQRYNYTSYSNSYSYYTDDPFLNVKPGDWVYFSIFFQYQQQVTGIDLSWYERLATLSVQIPFLHNSKDSLWSKIPEYYRQKDNELADPFYQDQGPLYRFLDLFGWEMDRTRSLIDSVITAKDPLISHSSTIEQLCQTFGTEINTTALGTAKARALLSNIGYLRQRKGTYGCAIAYINALTGCAATYSGSTITIYTQQVNLIPNPRFSNSYSNWQVLWEFAGSVTTSGSAGGPITLTSGASATKVAIQSNVLAPVKTSNSYYMSISSPSFPATVYGGTWTTSASFSNWSGASVPAVHIDAFPPRRYYEMPAPTSASMYPVFVFSLPANTSVTLENWMLEPNNIGNYFDGSSFVGGYVRPTDPTIAGLFDYRWGANSATFTDSNTLKHNAFSFYTLDYLKSKEAVTRILQNNIMPVGATYTLVWNAIP
jgi:hypothetical protein